MKPEARNQIVKKHVAAIHVNTKLSLLQRKLVNALLYNAYNDLLTSETHEINTVLLCEMIGFESKNDAYLKGALRGLMETVVEFNVFEDGSEAWEIMSLFSYARIQGGKCRYRYDRALAEKLYKPEIYSQINLGVLRELKSVHSLVLYENCHRYVNATPPETRWMDLEVFRKLMGVDQTPSYRQFKTLNRAVIKPAMEEVNKYSNISISMETKKAGRAVTQVKFKVLENAQLSLLSMDEDDDLTDSKAYQALRNLKIPKALARSWLLEYGEEYALEKVRLTNEASTKGKITSSKAGFLRQAIAEDYQGAPEASGDATESRRQMEERRRELEAEKDRLERGFKAAERAYRKLWQEEIDKRLSGMSEKEQEAASDAFASSLEGKFRIDGFRKDGWKNLMAFQSICAFWMDRGITLPSLAEFALENFELNLPEAKDRVKEIEIQLSQPWRLAS